MRLSAAVALNPLIFAGSASGPIITKSLYMTARREVPLPSAIQTCSASGECVSSTSPSPRAPSFKMSPLPATIAFTIKPDFLAKASVKTRKIPLSWVVVVVRMMSSLGLTGCAVTEVARAANATK